MDKPTHAAAVRLSNVAEGQEVEVQSIHGGQELKARLTAMGIMPGARLRVMRNASRGPFIVAVKGSRVMLGRGMAQKLEVRT